MQAMHHAVDRGPSCKHLVPSSGAEARARAALQGSELDAVGAITDQSGAHLSRRCLFGLRDRLRLCILVPDAPCNQHCQALWRQQHRSVCANGPSHGPELAMAPPALPSAPRHACRWWLRRLGRRPLPRSSCLRRVSCGPTA